MLMYIESEQQLREIYGHPKGRAKDKQLSALEQHCINFIEHSPFITISTRANSGLVDCSPRGGKPGFVKVQSATCIIIPDSKGNNRLDSLVNIVETGDIGCLFLIPGVDETLRINGVARISTSVDYLSLFSNNKHPPKTCIELTIKEVFLHCAKALMRSKLWEPNSIIERTLLPTMGSMINDQLSINESPENQEHMVARYEHDL
jgi:PPOX class probable FMN-dependent enzyme